jgi:glycosyltransferase involved in cell wall biosynthesis
VKAKTYSKESHGSFYLPFNGGEMKNDSPTIEFISDFTGVSGYGEAARSSLRAMIEAELNVKIKLNAHDKNTTKFDNYWEKDNKLRKKIEEDANNNEKPDVRIWCQTPNMFDKFDKDVFNIGWTLWETSRIPDFDMFNIPTQNWVSQLNKCDMVWTSCNFSKEIFIKSGVTKQIEVVGHPRNWDLYKKRKTSDKFLMNGKKDSSFKFLSVSQWTPRKGFDDLIIAYLNEFTDKDNVNLILKVYVANFDDMSKIKHDIDVIRNGINKQKSRFPQISILFKNIPQEEMPLVYNMCDCFILPSKGEGFGLPIIEAMGSEMLCISPDHTAMKDYINEDNAIVLKKWQKEYVNGFGGMHVYQSPQCWYRCNTFEIGQAMRKAYNLDDKTRRKISKAAREKVTGMYSYGVLGSTMRNIILSRKDLAAKNIHSTAAT